ncbi:MAG: cupin domain-containing protein [Sediminicola sp.]
MTFNLSEIAPVEIMPGYFGKLLHTQLMTLVFWEVETGATVPEHSHINEQVMHVMEGEFEFTLNGKSKIHVAGDLVVIPSHAPHSGKAITPCKLMDVFSPVREYK